MSKEHSASSPLGVTKRQRAQAYHQPQQLSAQITHDNQVEPANQATIEGLVRLSPQCSGPSVLYVTKFGSLSP